ncbi:hypothetical protein ACFXPY_17580, partial [Streptomyces sp. NPDC059153]
APPPPPPPPPLPIAGDDPWAKAAATELLDLLGYDGLDAGPLAESWRFIACGAQSGTVSTPDQASFSNAGLHPWAEAQTTTVKVIWATAPGIRCPIERRDIDLLLSTQNRDGIWEGNLLVHLSALHALHRLGGHEDLVRLGADRCSNTSAATAESPSSPTPTPGAPQPREWHSRPSAAPTTSSRPSPTTSSSGRNPTAAGR